MAKQPSISNAAAIAACDAITALIDEAGGDEGRIRIYSGAQPADVDTPITSQVLLADLQMNNPAFAAAFDTSPNATAVANTITDDTNADNSGNASFFRIVTKSGVAVIDGSVGIGDFDLTVDSITISAGQTVQMISAKYAVREV